jgi:hypothetical protein
MIEIQNTIKAATNAITSKKTRLAIHGIDI